MNIAHLLPASARFPVKEHNGRYEWALSLARYQASKGHTVTIYCATGSRDESSNIIFDGIEKLGADNNESNVKLINVAFSNSTHDIFHSHFDYLPHTLANDLSRPLVTTQHWYPNDVIAKNLKMNFRKDRVCVPLTEHMKRFDESMGINSTRVIHHGIDLKIWKYSKSSSERLLFVGRICPAKGVKEAVELATQTDNGLDILGKIREKDKPYFDSFLHLIDGNKIKYHGSAPKEVVIRFMRSAKAMIFPSATPEAFGLVTVEAQACGTPVIISNIGASSELVKEGVTGFVFQDMMQALDSIHNLDRIDRRQCRVNSERFDISIMHRKYDELYQELISC